MKVGAKRGHDDLESLRDGLDGWRVVAVALRQANHASIAAEGAAQLFGPLIGHAGSMRAKLWKSIFADLPFLFLIVVTKAASVGGLCWPVSMAGYRPYLRPPISWFWN